MIPSDKLVFRLHRLLGIVAGLFILMLSLTGALLALGDSLDARLNADLAYVAPQSGPAQPDAVLQTIRSAQPTAKLLNLQLYPNQPGRTYRAEVATDAGRQWLYLNPYTGAMLGQKNRDTSFLRIVRELHEHLLLPPFGDYVLFLVGVALLGSVLTGTWYYRRSLLSVFQIGVRWKKPRRLVYADLHKYLGVVGLLFMALMGATGTFFHFEHIERHLGRVLRGPSPVQEIVAPPAPLPLTNVLKQAEAAVPGFIPEFVQFADRPDDVLIVRGNTPDANRLLGKFTTSVEFSPISGQRIRVFQAADADLEYKAEHIFEELHFGRFGGWVTQTLWALLGVATAIVTATGLLLWWVKR